MFESLIPNSKLISKSFTKDLVDLIKTNFKNLNLNNVKEYYCKI